MKIVFATVLFDGVSGAERVRQIAAWRSSAVRAKRRRAVHGRSGEPFVLLSHTSPVCNADTLRSRQRHFLIAINHGLHRLQGSAEPGSSSKSNC